MDYEQLSELNKDFAEKFQEMNKEFTELFKKWGKKSFRLSIVMAIHMPMNVIMNLIAKDKHNSMPRLFEDLPQMIERFLNPFVEIKEKWGKISCEDFAFLYQQEYEKQFDKIFFNNKEKQEFKNWFEKDSKKNKNAHSR